MLSQLSLFNAVPAGVIETLFDEQNQPNFKRADLEKFLNILNARQYGLDRSMTISRGEIEGRPIVVCDYSRSGMLGGGKNPHDIFVTLGGTLEITLRSRKAKAVKLISWLAQKGVEKLQDELKEQRQAIEDKDIAMALLEDDLDDRDKQVIVLGDKIEELQQRAVPHLEDPGKDNSMVIIQKNSDNPWPYLAICGQQGYVAQKIRNKLVDYPKGEIVVLAETPNSIVHYNWLRERRYIEVNPECVRHFRLGEHYKQ